MYYNYHAVIKKKIRNGQLTKLEISDKKEFGTPVLLLFFDDGSHYPIKEERMAEYLDFIEKEKNSFN